jgi:hypothetical protein
MLEFWFGFGGRGHSQHPSTRMPPQAHAAQPHRRPWRTTSRRARRHSPGPTRRTHMRNGTANTTASKARSSPAPRPPQTRCVWVGLGGLRASEMRLFRCRWCPESRLPATRERGKEEVGLWWVGWKLGGAHGYCRMCLLPAACHCMLAWLDGLMHVVVAGGQPPNVNFWSVSRSKPLRIR